MTAIAGCVLPESIECTRSNLSGGIYSIISLTARDFGLTNEKEDPADSLIEYGREVGIH
jgi:hypothetical protein